MNTESRSLVGEFCSWFGLSQAALTIAVGLLLTLLMFLAAYADGGIRTSDLRALWNMGLEPAIIVYVVATNSLLFRRWGLAIDALGPLTVRPELVEQGRAVSRRGEWAALLLGAAFAIWITSSESLHGRWLLVYRILSNIFMFGVMALLIYDGLARAWRLKSIVRAGLQLDLFNRHALAPLARWGQIVSLTFVGGICLSLIFQSYETLYTVQSLVVYSILIAVSLTLFFSSIWSIHGALVAAQERELAVVRGHWIRARHDLLDKLANDTQNEVAEFYEPIVVLSAYESLVLSASTWPFNPKIVREVLASLIAPVLIYGLKIALGLKAGA
jgi:hypothetical protein